ARVDHHDVRGRVRLDRPVAARLQARLQLGGVRLVEAAAECREGHRHHATTGSLSWPHGAPMSSPLLQRTVVVTPASSRIAWNARMRGSGERRKPEASQSLNGIRLTFARTPRSSCARRRACSGLSLTSSSMTYSKKTRC